MAAQGHDITTDNVKNPVKTISATVTMNSNLVSVSMAGACVVSAYARPFTW